MKRLALLVMIVLLVPPAPSASAKGPTDVTVSGPGVNQTLLYSDPPGQVALWRLSDAVEIHRVYGIGSLGKDPGLTETQLGPRYVLTWRQGSDATVVQHAYPFAEGGALVWVLPDQSMFGDTRVPAGWIRVGPALQRLLVRLGAEPAAETEGASTSPATSPSAAPATSPDQRLSAWTYGIGVSAVLAVAALALTRRARRGVATTS